VRQKLSTAEERLERMLAFQSLLARVSRDIGPALELQPVLQTVLTAMRTLVDFKGGTICLIEPDGVAVAAADPPVTDDVLAARVPVGSGLAGRCVSTGRPVYSADLDADSRVDPVLRSTGSNAPMKSYLAVPLICLGQVIGLMQVDSTEPDAFDADDLHMLEGLATQVAGLIESAKRFEQVSRLEQLRSLFVARVSHELRTPLTIFRGYTTTLLTRGDSFQVGDQARSMLQRIDAAGERLQSLIEKLLMASSLEAGMVVAAPEDVNVRPMLDAVRLGSANPDKVTVRCAPDVHLFTDPKLVRHIVDSLVENALRYAGDAEVSAGVDERGPYVVVSDHGPGIPADRRDNVFEAFARGDHTEPGWGLGLSLVRTLSLAIGALIRLDEAPGGGARFTIRFS
jgi:signal transduction histidine kinase